MEYFANIFRHLTEKQERHAKSPMISNALLQTWLKSCCFSMPEPHQSQLMQLLSSRLPSQVSFGHFVSAIRIAILLEGKCVIRYPNAFALWNNNSSWICPQIVWINLAPYGMILDWVNAPRARLFLPICIVRRKISRPYGTCWNLFITIRKMRSPWQNCKNACFVKRCRFPLRVKSGRWGMGEWRRSKCVL